MSEIKKIYSMVFRMDGSLEAYYTEKREKWLQERQLFFNWNKLVRGF